MKVAVMMRPIDQPTGFQSYMEWLLEKLLEIDTEDEWLLLYRTDQWLGRFADRPRVQELLIGPSHKALWDQLGVPWAAFRHGADVIYNPKFSVPLVSHCPVAMGIQEPAWWATPHHHTRLDALYMRTFLPLYCRRASHYFPWTRFMIEETRKYVRLPLEPATVTYAAPSPSFRPIEDRAELDACRAKYELPERFVLTATRVENIGNQRTTFSDTKNPETAIKAFLACRDQLPGYELVVAGKRVREYLETRGWRDEDLSGVRFLGLVPREDLARLHNLAELFVVPSFYEGMGLTIVEAMACGCPVLASRTGACPETAGGAAELADPHRPEEFAEKLLRILRDPAERAEMRRRSLARAAFFDWDKTARAVLAGLRQAAGSRRGS